MKVNKTTFKFVNYFLTSLSCSASQYCAIFLPIISQFYMEVTLFHIVFLLLKQWVWSVTLEWILNDIIIVGRSRLLPALFSTPGGTSSHSYFAHFLSLFLMKYSLLSIPHKSNPSCPNSICLQNPFPVSKSSFILPMINECSHFTGCWHCFWY